MQIIIIVHIELKIDEWLWAFYFHILRHANVCVRVCVLLFLLSLKILPRAI